jgi:hypothetical protein
MSRLTIKRHEGVTSAVINNPPANIGGWRAAPCFAKATQGYATWMSTDQFCEASAKQNGSGWESNPCTHCRNDAGANDLSQEHQGCCTHVAQENVVDNGLVRVMIAWPRLPKDLRNQIVRMVEEWPVSDGVRE